MNNKLPYLQTNDRCMYVNCGVSLRNSLTQYVKYVGIRFIISHLYLLCKLPDDTDQVLHLTLILTCASQAKRNTNALSCMENQYILR